MNETTPKIKIHTSALVTLTTGFLLLVGLGWTLFTFIPNSTPTKTVESQTTSTIVASTGWINVSPGGGGAFTSIGAGPTGIILVASDLSGAYRSQDRGQTWDVIGLTRGLQTTHVSAVAFDPVDATRMFLGTEKGLYLSTNSGDTFLLQPTLSTGYVGAIVAAPSNPTIVYAGRHSDWNKADGKIYKSTDRGVTWSLVSGPSLPGSLRILKVLVHPTNANIIYLLSGSDYLLPSDQIPTQTLHRSLDGGVTWNQIDASPTLGDLWDFVLHPTDIQTLYLTTHVDACTGQACPTAPCPTSTSNWTGCVFKSMDGGVTWNQKTNHTGVIFIKQDQPNTLRTIDIQQWPGNANAGIWKSVNSGDTWSQEVTATSWDGGWQGNTPTGIQRAYGKNVLGYAKTLGVDRSNPDVMFLVDSQFAHAFGGTEWATFKNLYTNPVGSGWRSRGLDNVAVIDLAQSGADRQRFYSAAYDIGLWRSSDSGQSWQTANSPLFTGTWQGYGGNTTTVVADPSRVDVVWASMGQESKGDFTLVKSVLGGSPTSWFATTGLAKETGVATFINGLSVDRTSPPTQRTLFVTSTGDVYRSQNDGLNWSKVLDCNTCRTTAIDNFNGQIVYAAGEGGLWRSTNGGNNWTAPPVTSVTTEMSGIAPSTDFGTFQWTGIHRIVPDPITPGQVYAVAYGSGKGLYRSSDQGATWVKVRACTYCRSLAINPGAPHHLYLTSSYASRNGHYQAAAEGVLRSTDGGVTWSAWNEGLAWTFGWPIVFDPSYPYVFIGSPGTGFFRRDATIVSGGGGCKDSNHNGRIDLGECLPMEIQ